MRERCLGWQRPGGAGPARWSGPNPGRPHDRQRSGSPAVPSVPDSGCSSDTSPLRCRRTSTGVRRAVRRVPTRGARSACAGWPRTRRPRARRVPGGAGRLHRQAGRPVGEEVELIVEAITADGGTAQVHADVHQRHPSMVITQRYNRQKPRVVVRATDPAVGIRDGPRCGRRAERCGEGALGLVETELVVRVVDLEPRVFSGI